MYKLVANTPHKGMNGSVGIYSWEILTTAEYEERHRARAIRFSEYEEFATVEEAIQVVARVSAHFLDCPGSPREPRVRILGKGMSLSEFRQTHGKAERDRHIRRRDAWLNEARLVD
jgi:hypothetical protein